MTSKDIAELKEKMKIEENIQKMVCMGCGEYYVVQLYVRDGTKYFPIPEFICLSCNWHNDLDELGKIECGR